jgi:two-component system chemotaxis sensor kinase CheA
MSQVRETVEVKADDVRTLQGRPLFLFRKKAIPLAHLGRALGRTGGDPRMSGPAVVVERQGGEAALLIDRMLGQQEIVIKPLSAMVKQVRTFSGATIGRDGRPMLILDVNNLALK